MAATSCGSAKFRKGYHFFKSSKILGCLATRSFQALVLTVPRFNRLALIPLGPYSTAKRFWCS